MWNVDEIDTSSPDGGQLDEGRMEGDRKSKCAQDLQEEQGHKFICKLSIDFGMFCKILIVNTSSRYVWANYIVIYIYTLIFSPAA